MSDTLTPPTPGPADAPTIPVVERPSDLTENPIAAAAKAQREKAQQAAASAPAVPAAPSAPAAPVGDDPLARDPASPEQPRNADGTFASKDPAAPESSAAAESAESPTDPEVPVAEAPEPKVLVLKGEEQRGEADIELDATDLPPEVMERIDRLQKQGMRRAEYDAEMRRVRADRANLDAVETEMAVDPEGFVINRLAPARQLAVAESLLLEKFDELAPMIQELWNDPSARLQKVGDLRKRIDGRRSDVMTAVQSSRAAAEIRAEVSALIPDGASDSDARDFFASAIAILQQKIAGNESVTATDVPKLLADHRRRFFGAADASPIPAVRPKLAVRSTPSPSATAVPPKTPPKSIATQADVAAQIRARTAALAVAPQGAGAGAIQRPKNPNETVEEASRRLRGQRSSSAA